MPDSLVPGGIFYGREREAFRERAEDLEKAFDDLTDAQRMGIAKDTLVGYLTGRGLGKLGEAKITEQGLSLDDLLERGDINNVDYLKNVFKSSFGGLGDSELEKLNVLNRNVNTTAIERSMKLNVVPSADSFNNLGNNLKVPFNIEDYKRNPLLSLDEIKNSLIPTLELPLNQGSASMLSYGNLEDMLGNDSLISNINRPGTQYVSNNRNSLFQSAVGPMGGLYG